MATIAYPIAQSGSFNAGSTVNLNIKRAVLVEQTVTRDTTGTSGGTMDAQKESVQGLTTGDVYAEGSVILESGGSVALGQDSTLATASDAIAINPQQWALRKSWDPLIDVTGTGHTKKQWRHPLPSVTGTVSGNILAGAGAEFDLGSGGAPITTTVTFVIDNFGTLATAVVIPQKQVTTRFAPGGPPQMSFSFVSSGAASTWTPTSSNYTWLFPTGAANALGGEPVRATLALDMGATANVSESALLYDCTLMCNASQGGEVTFQARFRFDG